MAKLYSQRILWRLAGDFMAAELTAHETPVNSLHTAKVGDETSTGDGMAHQK